MASYVTLHHVTYERTNLVPMVVMATVQGGGAATTPTTPMNTHSVQRRPVGRHALTDQHINCTRKNCLCCWCWCCWLALLVLVLLVLALLVLVFLPMLLWAVASTHSSSGGLVLLLPSLSLTWLPIEGAAMMRCNVCRLCCGQTTNQPNITITTQYCLPL